MWILKSRFYNEYDFLKVKNLWWQPCEFMTAFGNCCHEVAINQRQDQFFAVCFFCKFRGSTKLQFHHEKYFLVGQYKSDTSQDNICFCITTYKFGFVVQHIYILLLECIRKIEAYVGGKSEAGGKKVFLRIFHHLTC